MLPLEVLLIDKDVVQVVGCRSLEPWTEWWKGRFAFVWWTALKEREREIRGL
jgi:hypothetical protein